jgi:hypothetical protein
MGNLGPGIAPLPVEKERSHADSRITQRRPSSPSTGWSRRPEQVVAINWNEWSRSIGIAGRDQPVRADKTTVDPAHRQASTLSRRRRGADRPMSSAALATGLPAARSISTRPSAVASLATETRNYRPCRDRSLRGRPHQANHGRPQDAARYRDPRRDVRRLERAK